MIKIKPVLILSVFVISIQISGCSSKYPVTIDSNPQGAMVSCRGRSFGYTPVTRNYTLNKEIRKSGFLNTCAFNLKWVSGATATSNSVFDLQQFPKGVRTTSPRPDVDGYAQDAEFALKVQQMRIQKSQAKAAESQAYQQSLQNFNNSMQNIQNNTRKRTSCTYYEFTKTTICN